MSKDKDLKRQESDHWLVRPETIKMLWAVFLIVLALLVLFDFFISHHPHFGIDGTIGFGAWFGFLSCVVLVVAAKVLGKFLKRPEGYYDN